MSDLTATNCGCGCENGNGMSSCLWIILLSPAAADAAI